MSGQRTGAGSTVEALQREALMKLSDRITRILRLGAGPALSALYGTVLAARPSGATAAMFAASLALWAAFVAGGRISARGQIERAITLVARAVYAFCLLPAVLLDGVATAMAVTGIGVAVMASVFFRRLLWPGLAATGAIIGVNELLRFWPLFPQVRLPPLLAAGYQNGHAVMLALLIVFLMMEYEKLSALPFERLQLQASLQEQGLAEVNQVQGEVEPLVDRVRGLARGLERQAREQLDLVRGGEKALAELSAAVGKVVEEATRTFETFASAAVQEGGSSSSEKIGALLAGYDRLLEMLRQVEEGSTSLARGAEGADRLIGSIAQTTDVGRALSIAARVEAAREGQAASAGGFGGVASALSEMIGGTSTSLGQGHVLLRAVQQQASKVASSTREGAARLQADVAALRGAAELSEAIEADFGAVQVRIGLTASALGEKCAQLAELESAMRELHSGAERILASSQKLEAATRRLAGSREELERILKVAGEGGAEG